MSNQKISQLADGGNIQDSDILPVVRDGENFKVTIPEASASIRGLVGTGYQTFGGGKNFRNDSSGNVKGLGLYNADPTDNNGLFIVFETDTTGDGAQVEFGATVFGSEVVDHNNATFTATAFWNTYINGVSKAVWSINSNLDLYTDGKIATNNDININNPGNLLVNGGFVRSGGSLDVLTGQGFNQSMNSLSGGVHVPPGTPIVGTNIFGTNLAVGFIWEDSMDGGEVPFLGACAVGYIGYMKGYAGKTMETINMSIAGLSDEGSEGGSALDNLNMYTAAGLISGTACTINNMRMFYMPAGLGGVATNEWGVSIGSIVDNYFAKSITIGGDGITTNPEVGFEIKDLKTLNLPRFTTAQKNAIGSPELGMKLFDTDLDEENVYTTGGWAGPSGLAYTAEDVDNKSTDVTMLDNSDILYPSQKAAKTYADNTSIINSIIFGA